MDVPPDAWATKSAESVRVQCNTSGEIWYLTCKDGDWVGELGNCSGKYRKYGKLMQEITDYYCKKKFLYYFNVSK